MSAAKHTPRPWFRLGEGTTVHPEREGFDQLAVIAQCKTRKGGVNGLTISRAEAIANANLIAAAPELADALEAYLDCLGGGFLLDAGKPIILARIEALHIAARAAIAKAGRR